jgi:hypothetical protein
MIKVKGKAIAVQAWTGQQFEAPRFPDNRQMKVTGLSAVRTGRLYPPPPPGDTPGTHFS